MRNKNTRLELTKNLSHILYAVPIVAACLWAYKRGAEERGGAPTLKLKRAYSMFGLLIFDT